MKKTFEGLLGLLGFLGASLLLFRLVFTLYDQRGDLRDAQVIIGSKAFTESILLAEVMAQLIERQTTAQVLRRPNLGGTHICFEAIKSGEIDIYPEYTGTGLMAILKEPRRGDPQGVWARVHDEFSKRFALEWQPAMAFNNTYALAMTERRAADLGVSKVSDLKGRRLVAGFATEFLARSDGYPGLKKTYGLELRTRGMEAGLMYGAVVAGEVDVISAYATDGRIEKFSLIVLEDDRRFFPPYQAAALVRLEALRRFPRLEQALGVLEGELDDAEMRRLNAAIDIDHRSAESVASELISRLLAENAKKPWSQNE